MHSKLICFALLVILSVTACAGDSRSALENAPALNATRINVSAATPLAPAPESTVTPPSVTIPRPTASPTPVRYTVQEGDTLFAIALNYGVTLEAIAAANQLANPELIHPGQVLVIPSGPLPPRAAAAVTRPGAGTAGPGSYVVQSGDSLFAIALENGITVESIVLANQIKDPEFIRPGQVLVIPTEPMAPPQPAATKLPVKPGAGPRLRRCHKSP